MLVNQNTAVQFVHVLTNVTLMQLVQSNTTFDFNNVLVNVEINIMINKCC